MYTTTSISVTEPTASISVAGPATLPPKSVPVQIPRKGIIHSLRKRGFKIRVRHYRWALGKQDDRIRLSLFTSQNRKSFSYISSTGGMTEADVTFPDGETITARSLCNDQDSYCRRLGAYLAFKRAVQTRKTASLS